MAGLSSLMAPRRLDTLKVRRNFSRQATEYERHAVVQRRVAERLLQLLLEGGLVGGPALEIGAGTGYLLHRLRRLCPGVRPVISDLAHAMTCQAAARLPQVPAVDADAQALPLRCASLSLVVSSSVYQWVEDLPLAFAEIARVLQPGGRFAIALFGARTLHELRDSHRRGAAEAGRHPSHALDFPDRSTVADALAAAGFTRYRLQVAEEWEFYSTAPELLRHLKQIGALNAATDRPPGLASRQVMQRLAAHYERFRQDGKLPATYQVIYVLGRKTRGVLPGGEIKAPAAPRT
ncbi:MAG: methyltransferase domain-containing protein [Desulfuromonadales bacterium]|nr:methyltransferase domain-containing protein [Desulfuromonadales bacterium]